MMLVFVLIFKLLLEMEKNREASLLFVEIDIYLKEYFL